MTTIPSLLRTPALAAAVLLNVGYATRASAAAAVSASAAAVVTPEAVTAARALVARVLPAHADRFVCEMIAREGDRDVFEIEAVGGKIVLRGNDGVSLAMAFNTYLRECARIAYDRCGEGVPAFSGELPAPERVRRVCVARERLFLSEAAHRNDMLWWNAAQWTRFVDWMAMNGVNRPLMPAGIEAVRLEVWKSYGLTEAQCLAHIGLPLSRRGAAAPASYVADRRAIQRVALARARSLGMSPILLGFSGRVPPALRSLRPQARITRDAAAGAFLDPADPLFAEIQGRFLRVLAEFYGTDGRYAAEPFDELTPPGYDPGELAGVAASVAASLRAADPRAVWYRSAAVARFDKSRTPACLAALVRAVPAGGAVYLDCVTGADAHYRKTENFYGAPFVWNLTGDFGGDTQVVAPVAAMSESLARVLAVPNCLGVGVASDDLRVNPVLDELMLAQPWSPNARADLDSRLERHAAGRAGRRDAAVETAWRMLAEAGLVVDEHACVFSVRPDSGSAETAPRAAEARLVRRSRSLMLALDTLFHAAPESRLAEGFRFDAVNLTRRALGLEASIAHGRVFAAIQARDRAGFRRESARFLELGEDLDALLATRREFLAGRRLAEARSLGADEPEREAYARCAFGLLVDRASGASAAYAPRPWNGLLAARHLPRWREFFRRVDLALGAGAGFDRADFRAWCAEFEARPPDLGGDTLPAAPRGDAVATAERVCRKYRATSPTAAGALP